MDSFGEYLKRERKLRGVTLEEISKASNISKTYLEALENDDSENLPAEVFVKGFLRCYAENTGMDHNEVILAYNTFVANKKAAQTDLQSTSEQQPTFNLKLSSFLAIVIFIVVSSFLVFYYVKKSGEIKSSSVSEEKISQETDTADGEKVEESENNTGALSETGLTENIQPEDKSSIQPENIEAEPVEQGISDSTAPLASSGNLTLPAPVKTEETSEIEKTPEILTLSIKATESAWVIMIIDDNEKKEALLVPGETAKWQAKEKFVLGLGNASGTTIKLNGKNITLPKAHQNVIKDFTITLDNIN